MATLLVSRFDELNIFHSFSLEVKSIWDIVTKHKNTEYIVFLQNYIADNPVHAWRRDILSSILPVYINKNDIEENIERIHSVDTSKWMVNPWEFIDCSPSVHYMALAEKVKNAYQVNNKSGKYVLYVKRNKSRKLFDYKSHVEFDVLFCDWCESQKLPYKIACFDNATFQEQVSAVSEAKVMISCHGAANTNIFLLPDDGHLFEINFRKYWHCDPVCDDHFSGIIPYTTKCRGKLTYRRYFHKADYYNLCKIFDKGYTELFIEDADTYLSRNPIDIMNIYVNTEKIQLSLFPIVAGLIER